MARKAISLLSPNVLTCQCLALSTCLEAECHLGFFLLFFQCVVTSRPVLPPETLGNQIVFSNSARIQWILTVYKRNNRIHFTSSALLSYAELTGVKNKSPNPHASKSIWTHTDQGCSNNGQTSAGSYGKLPCLRKQLEAMPKAQAVSPLPPCCSSNCCCMSRPLSKVGSVFSWRIGPHYTSILAPIQPAVFLLWLPESMLVIQIHWWVWTWTAGHWE